MLTPEQASLLQDDEEVISVFESKRNRVDSTHSWDFLGVNLPAGNNLGKEMHLQSDVIVGCIDSGIWPESESFNDAGLGPVPKRFKGECVSGQNFSAANCNRKIIGARYYSKGIPLNPLASLLPIASAMLRPRDPTRASTITGSIVPSTSMLGMAPGVARGGAFGARLVVYKACWFGLCSDADILAAFDDAVADGVEIISMSVSPIPPQPSVFSDVISIGSFHAFRKKILVTVSAGNTGLPASTTIIAPWMMTVAASSIDRQFNSYVHLGNSKVLRGTSLNPTGLTGHYPIISASAAAAPVQKAGGVAMIVVAPQLVDLAFLLPFPNSLIGQAEAQVLDEYLSSERYPTATISKTFTVLDTTPAPQMAFFSSQGPNLILPDIIKPDITAPGVNILACVSLRATVEDNTHGPILRYPNGSQATPFDYGSGHLNPVAAINPGLVYDFRPKDIINFLCSNGATSAGLKNLTGYSTKCSAPLIPSYNFNYPSIGVSKVTGKMSVYRTVTNAHDGDWTYRAAVENPAGVWVSVVPEELVFSKFGEKKSYRIDLVPYEPSSGRFVFGSVTWSDGTHRVRSPIGLNVVSV
ncbi:uncharacterized protein A4U43_C09F130 [Asparagus officinalis]|uniref:Subtilisin-like protease fibronectin type-III domain-containing protein n=1 Tax=Asparagus officinalis TaxID=4686 RepID=A0A5P1E4C1_ASPOF|nr:uncharacterized protein A4U43_C09F130 [Asparagus officinalis]